MRKTISLLVFAAVSIGAYAAPPRISTFGGKVQGGQQPIGGSRLYLYEPVASTVSGASSKSILKSATGTTVDSNGNYYLTTAADGTFSVVAGTYTCDVNEPVYAYAVSGNPGGGINTAIGLLGSLGICSAAGAISTSTTLIVNEVTTVAMANAVAAFATDPTHISYSGSAMALQGIQNAFTLAINLVSTSLTTNGEPVANLNSATVPATTIDTLADILAACINFSSQTSTNCQTLFANATSTGTSTGSIPTDTATAAINIAHHPTAEISNLLTLVQGTGAPYQPTYSTAPNDLTVQLTFTGGGIAEPWAIAIDGYGNAWVASLVDGSIATGNYTQGGAITEISPADKILSPSGGWGSTFFSQANESPVALAVDASNNVWVTTDIAVTQLSNSGTIISTPFLSNTTNPSGCSTPTFDGAGGIAFDKSGHAWITGPPVFELSSTGANMSGCGYSYTGMEFPQGIAGDSLGNMWIGDYTASTVVELSSNGTLANTYTDPSIQNPNAVSIDHQNNVWVSNSTSNGITEISSFYNSVISTRNTGYAGGGLYNNLGIAIDGSGSAWVTPNENTDIGVVALSNTGSVLSGPDGYMTGTALPAMPTPNYAHYWSAIDGSGNVWMTNTEWSVNPSTGMLNSSDSITEILGVATPVVTPLAVAVANGTLGVAP